MVIMMVVSGVVGIVLAFLISVVPFVFVELVVLGLAAGTMGFVDSVIVFSCLQVGYCAGLVLWAFAGRFRGLSISSQAGESSDASIISARDRLRQAFSTSGR